MKLEPVAWVDQEKISALYDKRVSGIGAVLHKCSGSPSHKPLYVIPPGYVLVPVEPTEAMLNAARDWSYEKYGKPIGNEAAIGCYKAMIEGEQC